MKDCNAKNLWKFQKMDCVRCCVIQLFTRIIQALLYK